MVMRAIVTRVENCAIPDNDMKGLGVALGHFEGKEIVITIFKKKHRISTEMHRYYRKAVLPLIVRHYRERGYDVDSKQVHKQLKQQFGPDEDVGIEEPMFRKKESMADYTKEESVEFVERLKREYAADGLYIPDPDEHLHAPLETY